MPDQIFIGDFSKGLKNDRPAHVIDNDAFPTLFNAYVWRGQVLRKRGTAFLARLQRQVKVVASAPLPWQYGPITLVGGSVNLITTLSLQVNSSITPGTLSLVVGGQTYTEPATPNGTLVGSGGGTGTINYATNVVTITGGGAGPLIGTFSYYPDLPVLGLEDYVSNSSSSQYPLTIGFDTTYAYQLNQTGTPFWYNISYYKGTNNPVVWSAPDFNQFWSCNYQSAFWVTNNKAGFHFVTGTYTSGSPGTTITFNFKSGGVNFTTLIVGDVLFFNEWVTSTGLNGINGVVSDITGAASGNYVVTFLSSVTVSGTGIAQLLTNSLPGQDGIRWYDGDPTGGTGLPTSTGLGWVNFMPPLTAISVSVNDQTPDLYYLVGALAILPFKDRILFFGPQIQSSTSAVIQRAIQDNVIWSWNGTPYYNALVPTASATRETFDVHAYYLDQTGFAGYLPAGISQPIITILANEDVLLIGFGGGQGKKTRLVYTGNDLQPFLLYLINSELPSSATFSGIALDRGGLEIGPYGLTMTTQQSCQRIDLDIPDMIFQIQDLNNGQQRVNAVRDFFREWIYFCYPTGTGSGGPDGSWVYPSTTLMFNYRDNTWAQFRENFTHHGTYRKTSKNTWASIGKKYGSWAQWRVPWNAGSNTALFPKVIAGNPQGFVLTKDEGTAEGISGAIAAIADDGFGLTQITSVNHCVNSSTQTLNVKIDGDYLLFSNAIGNTFLNGLIGKVSRVIDANNFVIDVPFVAGTYLGLGNYSRLSQPNIQTKQFPLYWQQGRQIRLGVQRYLFNRTALGQVTVNIALSQDPDDGWNTGAIPPSIGVENNSLVYSQIVYTCPEGINLGLTPSNINLQQQVANDPVGAPNQIWHRMNTSLIGDTFQVGITLNDKQMKTLSLATNEIVLQGLQFNCYPGPFVS